ncbi:MAG: FMN-binding negative transcriptional regulator [Lautropia sp.]
MYLPAHFVQPDPARLRELIAQAPLGTWIERDGDETLVNHVPFLWAPGGPGGHGVLVGHVARANPVWRALSGRPGIVVFQGPQAYVSPSWYPSKAQHHKVVPTWNYAVVHARGVARAIEDPVRVRDIVERLTQAHEAGRDAPWKLGDAPPDFVDAMVAAVVGIEIPIDALVGKWKASQNRSAGDRAGVEQGLRASARRDAEGGAPAIAMASLVAPFAPPVPPGSAPPAQAGGVQSVEALARRHDAAS